MASLKGAFLFSPFKIKSPKRGCFLESKEEGFFLNFCYCIVVLAWMMILFQSRGPWYLKTNFPVSEHGKEESELQCGELVPNFKL